MNGEGKGAEFEVGGMVLVAEGPFAGFRGIVVEVRPQVLHLEVSVFGLPTRIEVALSSVEWATGSAP